MKRITLSIFVCGILLGLSGCEAPVVVSRPRLAVLGPKMSLAVQVQPASDDGEYMLFSSTDSRRGGWRSQGRFGGRLIALLAGQGALLQVFADGTVVVIRDDEERPKSYGHSSRKLRLAAAVRIGGIPHALDVSQDLRIRLTRMRGNSWEQYGPSLAMLGKARMLRLTVLDDEPVVMWRNEIGGSIEPGIQCVRLEGDQWRPLAKPPVTGKSFFAVASDGRRLVLVKEPARQSDKQQLQALIFTENQWREVPGGIMIPGGIQGTAVSGMDLVLHEGRALLALTDISGLRVFASDNVTAIQGKWELVGTPYHVDLSRWQLWMPVVVFVAIAILLVLVNRWAAGRVGVDGSPRRRYGEPASPLDRALAMMLDGILVLPLPVGYVLYSGGIEAPEIIRAEQAYLYWIWLGGLSLYLAIAEARWGSSVGKSLLRIRVRTVERGPVSPLQAVVRNLARVVDFWPVMLGHTPVPYLVAMLCVLLSARRQRFGDTLAGTLVMVHVPLSKRKIVLASASPRRQELLRETGLEFTVQPADTDEKLELEASGEENAMRLARLKAEQVANTCTGDEIVIGADTLVILQDEAIGKPCNRDDAMRILNRLSGSIHQVVTAVAVIDRATGRMLIATEVTEVRMHDLGADEIAEYVGSGEADGKAGAYAIQESGDRFIKDVHGSLSNVIGLPLELLVRILKNM